MLFLSVFIWPKEKKNNILFLIFLCASHCVKTTESLNREREKENRKKRVFKLGSVFFSCFFFEYHKYLLLSKQHSSMHPLLLAIKFDLLIGFFIFEWIWWIDFVYSKWELHKATANVFSRLCSHSWWGASFIDFRLLVCSFVVPIMLLKNDDVAATINTNTHTPCASLLLSLGATRLRCKQRQRDQWCSDIGMRRSE